MGRDLQQCQHWRAAGGVASGFWFVDLGKDCARRLRGQGLGSQWLKEAK
jgi:hypothetical protein